MGRERNKPIICDQFSFLASKSDTRLGRGSQAGDLAGNAHASDLPLWEMHSLPIQKDAVICL